MEANLTTFRGTYKPIAQVFGSASLLDLTDTVKELLKLQPQNSLIQLEEAVLIHLGQHALQDHVEPSDPALNQRYLLNFYLDNNLNSSFIVRFIGMNPGLKWFVFDYEAGNSIEAQGRHLLSATGAHFPTYISTPYPGLTITEQYILIP